MTEEAVACACQNCGNVVARTSRACPHCNFDVAARIQEEKNATNNCCFLMLCVAVVGVVAAMGGLAGVAAFLDSL
jgi:hypothetical protein